MTDPVVVRFEVTFTEQLGDGSLATYTSAARFDAPRDSTREMLAAMAVLCWRSYRKDPHAPIWEYDDRGCLAVWRYLDDGCRVYFGAQPVPPARLDSETGGYDPHAADSLYTRETAQQRARDAAEEKQREAGRHAIECHDRHWQTKGGRK